MVPKVSVIMPSLNVAEYIEESVWSVQRQTLESVEIICVDAGSDDGTRQIIERLSLEDERIKVVDSPIRSYGYQVNLGIDMASAPYIGIVETDDYVEPDMFQRLYQLADIYALDYVKSNFRVFYNLEEGRLYQKNSDSYRIVDCYNQVITPRNHVDLCNSDAGIWRGIYQRDFLDRSRIRLNETRGAAYQDIGFLMQVYIYAERALYIPDTLYNYRVDRQESSSYKAEVLQFLCQEFKWLLEDKRLAESKPIALRMANCYCYELNKVLRKFAYDDQNRNLAASNIWLQEHLTEWIHSHVIMESDFSEKEWERLQLALNDVHQYAVQLRQEDSIERKCQQKLLAFVGDNPVIIFGCGYYGSATLLFLKEHQKNIVAFCDNDINCRNQHILGLPVMTPEDAIRTYPQACYVIANKNHSHQMKEQLENLGTPKIFCEDIMRRTH